MNEARLREIQNFDRSLAVFRIFPAKSRDP